MPHGPMREAVDASVSHQVSLGNLSESLNAAPIAMLRWMADFLDSDMGDTPAYRYVTPASFLSYCERLGLLPDPSAAARDAGGATATDAKRDKFRNYSGGGS